MIQRRHEFIFFDHISVSIRKRIKVRNCVDLIEFVRERLPGIVPITGSLLPNFLANIHFRRGWSLTTGQTWGKLMLDWSPFIFTSNGSNKRLNQIFH